MATTNIKLRVHFARNEKDLPDPLEKGVLYFIANQASIYNKDLPFSGINRVTSVSDSEGVITLNFNDNYGTDGNHLSVKLLSGDLLQVIKEHGESIADIIQRLDNLTLKDEYDLTQSISTTNISTGGNSGDVFEYDPIRQAYKAIGEIRIKCPRKSSYQVNLVLEKSNDGTITVNGQKYAIGNNMFFTCDDTDEIVLYIDQYVWMKALTVMEYKIPVIPKRVSELINDLNLVYSEVDNSDENLFLNIGQGRQEDDYSN